MLDGYGAEKTDVIQQNIDRRMGGRLDGIVSFFSLTFFPEKREMYDALLETIDLLPEGGKFIGAVMDGYKGSRPSRPRSPRAEARPRGPGGLLLGRC